LAIPDVSLALSSRETINLRNRLFPVVDQIGSGGVTNPGGRTHYKAEYKKGDEQFKLQDIRTPEEVIAYLNNRNIAVKPT
jgi:hypothetical protein